MKISNAIIQIKCLTQYGWEDFQSIRPATREGAMALLKTVRQRHTEDTFQLVLEDWDTGQTEVIV